MVRGVVTQTGDVVIVTSGGMEQLIQQEVAAGSNRDVGRVGVGVAGRAGGASPDISSPEAFKKAMLEAKSVMCADPALGGQSSIHTARVFEPDSDPPRGVRQLLQYSDFDLDQTITPPREVCCCPHNCARDTSKEEKEKSRPLLS